MVDEEHPHILVIDDEAGLRAMLQFSLADRGYHGVLASNGDDGNSSRIRAVRGFRLHRQTLCDRSALRYFQ